MNVTTLSHEESRIVHVLFLSTQKREIFQSIFEPGTSISSHQKIAFYQKCTHPHRATVVVNKMLIKNITKHKSL